MVASSCDRQVDHNTIGYMHSVVTDIFSNRVASKESFVLTLVLPHAQTALSGPCLRLPRLVMLTSVDSGDVRLV